jgi:polyhydroxybutyrate depolymerase
MRISYFAFALLLTSLTATGCDDSSNDQESDAVDAIDIADTGETADDTEEETVNPEDFPRNPPEELGEDRIAKVYTPSDYDRTNSYPLVVMLHGYGANGFLNDLIFKLKPRVDAEQFILVIPEGTTDESGSQFWNATPQCCNFDDSDVDDVGYLASLVEEAREKIHLDSDRIGFVGHSNGGYMSYRMACEHPEFIDRIAVLAGSTFNDPEDCANPQAVSVLHMHGTDDETIPYPPAENHRPGRTTIGAEATVDRWRERAGCSEDTDAESTADFDSSLEGEETDVLEWNSCSDDHRVQLWRINGGDHVLGNANQNYSDSLVDWLTMP